MTNLKEETYKIYKHLGSIRSKAIKDKVIFNRYGWIHLSFTSSGHKRSSKDRKLRFHLFPSVKEVIKKATIIVKESEGFIISKRGIKRNVKYYEIASKCDDDKKHVTVILRKIEDGKLHFYSLRRTSSKIKKALERGLI